ncbi:MAG: hypothetical protein M1561_00095 [Gammaproteobacteria bacterium]|nr:hypothetical protein [Gammaproteobacteria bacterium]
MEEQVLTFKDKKAYSKPELIIIDLNEKNALAAVPCNTPDDDTCKEGQYIGCTS